MITKELIFLHEYGEPAHYLGAVKSFNSSEHTQIKYVEFSTLKLALKALKNKNISKFKKAINDFLSLIKWFIFPELLKNKIIVLGAAPLDFKVIFLKRILSKTKVVYHSSWLYWDKSKYPKTPVFAYEYIHKCWVCFLRDTVNAFAVVTPEVKFQLVEHMGIEPKKIVVVYHCFNESIFVPNIAKVSDDGKVTAIFVGRLVANKGILELLTLCRQLPNLSMIIAGDGPLRLQVEKAANELTNLTYVGYIKDKQELSKLCQATDVVLLPSKRTGDWEELFGIALIEAMSCGCIPITTDHQGPKVILGESEFGKNIFTEDFFPQGSKQLLVQYINNQNLLSADKAVAVAKAEKYQSSSIALRWSAVFKLAETEN